MWKKIKRWVKYYVFGPGTWENPNYKHPSNVVASGDPCGEW